MHLVSLGDSFSCGEGVGLRIDLPQTWVGLLAVVEALLDTGADVLLVRLHDPGVMLPVPRQVTGPLRRGLAVRVGVLQATVDSLADRPGVHVLDLAEVPGLGSPAGWATDRIHPSAVGHRGIAVQASAVLRRGGRSVTPLTSGAQGSSGPSAAAQLRWLVAHGLPWTASHVRSVALPLLTVAAGVSRRSSRPVGQTARAAPSG